MEWYDLLMIAVLAGTTVFGFMKGMAWQIASLGSLVLSTSQQDPGALRHPLGCMTVSQQGTQFIGITGYRVGPYGANGAAFFSGATGPAAAS